MRYAVASLPPRRTTVGGASEITHSSVTMRTPALEANMAVIDSASIVGGALIILYAGQQLVEMLTTRVPTASGHH